MVAVADGPELYVYSGNNDAPMWKQFCDGVLVAVGANRLQIWSIDTEGKLCGWRGLDGAKVEETQTADLVRQPFGLLVASDGVCAVLAKDAVLLCKGGTAGTPIPVPGLTAAGMDPGHAALGAGTRGGKPTSGPRWPACAGAPRGNGSSARATRSTW
jgi:hypothetical protein